MTNNIGHNNDTAKRLKAIIEGVEAFEEQRKDLGESIKEVFDNAKSGGFDVKTIKTIIARRKKPIKDEEQYLLDTYTEALDSLPLFNNKQ